MVVNRAVHELSLEPERSLLSVLREELGLTGAKPGCGEGVCGACTVLVDGEPVRSCITLAIDVAGRAVTTVEGLARDGTLHPVQRAFVEEGAMQCGYCTPGMILGVASLLEKSPDPDEALIRESLAGNICRCCTYPRIVRAARRAAELAASDDEGSVDGAARRHARAAGARPRTVGPARSRGTRLLRRALRRDGRRPARRAERGWRVVDQQRRVDPRRRGRGRHGVHRQGRRRAGQPHRPVPTGRRGAARAVRARPAGDGRHRSVPVRHGHVRQPLDAGRRREPARDRGVRSGAPPLDGGGAVGRRRGWTRRVRRRRPRTRRRSIDRLRRAPAR